MPKFSRVSRYVAAVQGKTEVRGRPGTIDRRYGEPHRCHSPVWLNRHVSGDGRKGAGTISVYTLPNRMLETGDVTIIVYLNVPGFLAWRTPCINLSVILTACCFSRSAPIGMI
jgi:hypothetical protein